MRLHGHTIRSDDDNGNVHPDTSKVAGDLGGIKPFSNCSILDLRDGFGCGTEALRRPGQKWSYLVSGETGHCLEAAIDHWGPFAPLSGTTHKPYKASEPGSCGGAQAVRPAGQDRTFLRKS